MKRIKKIVIFLFLIVLFIPLTVHAEDTCADVMESVNELESIEAELSKIDCDSASTDKITAQCNTLKVNKTRTLEKIFEYNDENICSSIDLSSIIEANSDNCTNSLGSNFKSMVDSIMNLFYVTAPFILIIFGSLDFFKIVVGNDPNEIKKHRSNFFKRLAAFLLLYLTPFIVKTLFSIVPYDTEGNSYICTAELSLTNKTTTPDVTGEYTGENSTLTNNSTAGQKIANAAKKIKQSAIKNKYTWGCNFLPAEKQGTGVTNHMCCAEVLGAALLKAGIYDKNGAKAYQTASAPGLGNLLKSKGWKLITNKKDLRPGDVLFYEKLVNPGTAGVVVINGEAIHTCHTDIYYGEGKKVSTGGGFTQSNLLNTFTVNSTCYSVKSKWRYAFRYPGKK